jgi:hypothetical protein
MRRFWAVVLLAVAGIALAGVFLGRAGHAPAGQPPLVEINTAAIAALQAEFNQTSGSLRILLLLSPT